MPINYHSKIISYLVDVCGEKTNIDTIVNTMKSLNVKCKFKDSLIIFNYERDADFSNPIVQESRGIIMDMGPISIYKDVDFNNWKIVAFPFRKFGNFNESYADKITWETAQIQEKVDGSIIKLFWFNSKWNWATNSCISAEDATTPTGRSFMDVIKSADNFKEINYDILSKHKTYIFELVSPENKVVIEYPVAHLYHIGTRSNLTGVEFNTDIGIQKPKVYDITDPNLNKVLEVANKLNGNGICENEGFVVCDSDFNRVKIKNSQYLLLHHSLTNNFLPKREAIETIVYNDEEKIAAIQMNPILNVQFKFYDWQFTKFLYELDIYIKSSRSLYQSLQQSRKDFALKIKNDKFNSFGFISIDNPNLNTIQIIKKFGINKILRYIKDYRSL